MRTKYKFKSKKIFPKHYALKGLPTNTFKKST